jgi:hypothetical protein
MPEGLQMALNTQALEKRIAAHNVAREDGRQPDQSSLIARLKCHSQGPRHELQSSCDAVRPDIPDMLKRRGSH